MFLAESTTSEKDRFKQLLRIAIERIEKDVVSTQVPEARLEKNKNALMSLRKVMKHLEKKKSQQRFFKLQEIFLQTGSQFGGSSTSVVFFYLMGADQMDHMFHPLLNEFSPAHFSCVTVVGLEGI